MIGGAVESYNCEEAGSSHFDSSVHSQSNATWNHSTSGETANYVDVMVCKVSVAVTVTAVGGFFQVFCLRHSVRSGEFYYILILLWTSVKKKTKYCKKGLETCM